MTIFIVVIVALVGFSPTGCYLSRGAWEEAKILSNRRDITDILADRRVDSVTRAKLLVVRDARLYARNTIGLKTKDSFTAYSQLDRDTLVLVLSAAYRDTLAPYTWWFPIVGRVPYKGYFDFEQARKDAAGLEQDGYDTYLRPSDAFSTLGFFNDPLLSTTLQMDSIDLANTVIHEVTHNTFYAPGQVAFNESFASFVGSRGSELFFRTRGDTGAARIAAARWEDDKLLGRFWARLSTDLDSAYAAHRGDKAARLAARDSVYARGRRFLIDSVAPHFTTIPTRYASGVRLDNASLLARRVYATELQLFDDVWEREGRQLRPTVTRIIALAKSSPTDPYAGVRRWLITSSQK